MDVVHAAVRLARATSCAPHTTAELARLLDGWMDPELPADPWARWLLVALYQYLARQRSVGEAAEDFVDEAGDPIDALSYLTYLGSAPALDPLERRIAGSEAVEGWWMCDLSTLREVGWTVGGIQLTAAGEAWARALLPYFVALGAESDRHAAAWLALELGDATIAARHLGDDAPARVRAIAKVQRDERVERLTDRVRRLDVPHARFALKALGELGRPCAEPFVIGALARDPPDGVVCAAIRIVASWSDERHVPLLRLVLESARADGGIVALTRIHAATALMERGPRALDEATLRALTLALEAPAGPYDGEAAFLLALIDLEVGSSRLAEVLRAGMPVARQRAAAALAVIGTHETIEVLRASASDEAQTVIELLQGCSPEPGFRPAAHVVEHDGRPIRVYRLDEIMAAHAGELAGIEYGLFVKQYARLARLWLAS